MQNAHTQNSPTDPSSARVPSGLPKQMPMSSHVEAKRTIIPVLIMVGILLALILGALMMQTVRDGKFALSAKKSGMASVIRLAQVSRPDGVYQDDVGRFNVYESGSVVHSGTYDEVLAKYQVTEGPVIHSFEDSDTSKQVFFDPSTRIYYDTNPTSKPVFYTNGESEEQLRAAANSRAEEAVLSDIASQNVSAGIQGSATADKPLLPPPSLGSNAPSVNTGGANCTGNRCQFDNPLGQSGSLEVFLNKLLDVIILIGSIVVVLSIIMAGLKYVTAQGDEKQIESAHKQLTWTVIGAAILLGAKVIAMIVQNTVKALS